MAKAKPKRSTTIDSTIEQLKQEQTSVLKESTEILLVKISDISDLILKNNFVMHNRISYSKTKLLELADNISKLAKENAGIMGTGILNPVMLRKHNGRYERIHGDNRIKALALNGNQKVPAIILENVSDELARFMRSSENLNREDLNAYDETLSIIEHIQLASNFKNIEEVKSFINKIKNFQAGKTTLNDNEKILHKEVSEVFERIGRFDIITFVDRLSVLKLNPIIKQALVDETISYTQAKVIKSKLKDDQSIKKIIDVLNNKKLSVNELKQYIINMNNSKDINLPLPKSTLIDDISTISKSISKRKYLRLSTDKQSFVDKKLNEIKKLYTEIDSIIK